jgi:tetratricopeptide (TPR) repeat protein
MTAPLSWRRIAPWALLIVLGALAYGNSLRVPFLLDDEPNIVHNPIIKPPLAPAQLLRSDRPVVYASLALNRALGGLNVAGYHVVNLLAHVACALLLYGLVRHTLRLPALRARYGAAANALGMMAAVVFLVHPMQTAASTYIIQRAEIFAAAAVVGAVWLAARAAQQPRYHVQLPLLVLVTGLGLASKESAAAAPALFALYDWCFLAERRVRAMVARWPIYASWGALVACGLGWRVWQATHSGTGVALAGVDLAAMDLPAALPSPGRGAITPWRYFTWQLGVCLYYLRLVAYPDRLCFDCGFLAPWPLQSSWLGDAPWLYGALLGALACGAWWARHRNPLVPFAVFGSAIVLAPSSSVVPLTDIYFEHRMYLALGLVALLFVCAVYDAGEAAVRRGWLSGSASRRAQVALAVLVTAALAGLTIARNQVFADPIRLLQDSIAKAPASTRARYNLANEYVRRGQHDLAIQHYRALIEQDPEPFSFYVNLGRAYQKLNRDAEALEVFERARERAPNQAIIYRNLIVAYARLSRFDDAIAAAQRAVTLEPGNARNYKLLARALARVRRVDEADQAYRVALFLNPRDAEAQRELAQLSGRRAAEGAARSP